MIITCPECGRDFERSNKWQSLCSLQCRKARKSRANKAYYRAGRLPQQRPCRHCGEIFTRRPGFNFICSEECRVARVKAQATARCKRDRAWRNHLARRAYWRNPDQSRAKSRRGGRRRAELMMKGRALE